MNEITNYLGLALANTTRNNTMNTNITVFTNAVSEFVVSNVLSPLSQWLAQNKGVEVSVEEMAQVLQLPATPTQPKPIGMAPVNYPPQMPQIPGFLNGGQAGAVTQAGRSRAAKQPDANYNGPRCQYKFSRGARAGQFCGEPCLNGSNFCKNCVKKKSAGGPGTGATRAVPAVGGFQGMPGLPGMQGAPAMGAQQPQPQAQQGELAVTPLEGQPGYYRETTHGFIVTEDAQNNVVAYGIIDGGNVRKLNNNEQQIATQLGIVVPDDAIEQGAAQQPQAQQPLQAVQQPQAQQPLQAVQQPAMPTIPTLNALPTQNKPVAQQPAIPTIPTLNAVKQPTPQAQPAMPTIPTLTPQTQGTPQNQPAMPTIPTLTPLAQTPKTSPPAIPTINQGTPQAQ